ncbi:MAG: aminotransferase class I/II-fold pyridoxal phosphate-dependent enzyme [Nostoc sp. ChiQUE02]|uniref:aminotransferase class I/II-fold pyridoxal phosphate-dependent enzyme n=1 Tax=Nostoc sp. ChiQUE02 TaxID=3075377 RepID=UPI002AD1F323|nr:aminotransferase class I/II-fold pyridoxal phosphate-dependent enzyme [Nostoc sp. ChiQUE02]MDZ8228666.1 aminotransferase class I/II-fold pyridoxal phosphate-dependent enzyme [Nostoc sp. ChiQUE02]
MSDQTRPPTKTQQVVQEAATKENSDITTHTISSRLLKAIQAQTPSELLAKANYMNRKHEQGSIDFTEGDAHELPPLGFVEALQRWSIPQNESWFGYKDNLPQARVTVSEGLKTQRGIAIAPEDIFLTNGSLISLTICLQMLTEMGDEVIIITPPWLNYRRMIHVAGAVPVGVPVNPTTFDLDLDAIAAAITERTRAIVINSPHNPTGKIFSATTLQQLASLLTNASNRYGKPIYLISDETFSRIVFDQRTCPSPTQFYPFSFLIYGYSKVWMAPGQRIGYIALPPTMPERDSIRRIIRTLQGSPFGWCFPSALMQYALTDLDELTLDLDHLQHKRDWMVKALQEMGYKLQIPEGAFFLLVESPWSDDCAFAELLASHDVFVFPGTPQEIPGYFRISLTANADMISRALPKFQVAIEHATAKAFGGV